jgi:hypothetical protein
LERVALDRAASLEPFLSRLAITARDPAPGLVVELDGLRVGAAQLGAKVPIDPGTHTIRARAKGREEWRLEVLVLDDGKVTLVEIPPLPPARHWKIVTAPPPPFALVPAAGPAVGRFEPARAEAEGESGGDARKIAGIAVAAVGFVGAASGIVLNLDASFRRDRDVARRERNVGTAAIVLGATMIVVAIAF